MFSPPSAKRKRKATPTSTISSKKLIKSKEIPDEANKSVDIIMNKSAVDDIGSPPLELDFVINDSTVQRCCDDPPIPIPDIVKLNSSLDLLFALIILLICQIKNLSEKIKILTSLICPFDCNFNEYDCFYYFS